MLRLCLCRLMMQRSANRYFKRRVRLRVYMFEIINISMMKYVEMILF